MILSKESVEMMVDEYDPTEGHSVSQLYENLKELRTSHETQRAEIERLKFRVEALGKIWLAAREIDFGKLPFIRDERTANALLDLSELLKNLEIGEWILNLKQEVEREEATKERA